jgi:predicted MFS family arabinose efflux permease
MGVMVLPMILGSLVAVYGVSEGLAGFVISVELGAMTLTTLAMSPLIHKLNRRGVGIAAALLIVAGNLLAAAGTSSSILFVARAISGAGSGALMCAATAAAADHRNPDRFFAIVVAAAMLASIGMFLIVPELVEIHGSRSIFLAMAAVAGLIAIWSTGLPVHSRLAPAESTLQCAAPEKRGLLTMPSLSLLAAYLLFQVAMNGVYFYVERIGSSLGMALEGIGKVLAISAFVSLAGPLAAGMLGTRVGRIGPLTVATAVNGICVFTMTHTASVPVFAVAMVVSTAMLTFAMPYFLGLAASLVSGGRLASSARGAAALGSTITPAVSGGILLLGGSYGMVGWFGAACSAMAICLLVALGSIVRKVN